MNVFQVTQALMLSGYQCFPLSINPLAKTGLANDNYRAAYCFNCPNATEARKRKYAKEKVYLLLSFREARFCRKNI